MFLECLENLKMNPVTLHYDQEHKGIEITIKKVDKLPKEESTTKFIRPEPTLGISTSGQSGL